MGLDGTFPWWQSELVNFFIPKNVYQTSLASGSFKVFEHLIHARIAPLVNRRLNQSQGGFRLGADVLVGSLVNVLTMSASTHTWPLSTSRRPLAHRGWKRHWSDCMTLESKVLSGSGCQFFFATQCPKFDWAVSCLISGRIRASLKGGSYPRFFSISLWTGSQPRFSMFLQEPSCLGVFSVGLQNSCTLMTWCL